ncbi:type II secretion system protein [Arcobacter arenosus]|uniref:Prepilin-type N-terminal cleavage/methylation domain-containing protein n=1 Tax=Arcobacter arenosus TaxID=2576037 RepID=A0A5R8Y3P4_9BACT|nr:prepilin-type N-terminal cleavage/methylation domain-containing protein [Arcobacter arenosus]TLP40696.1 prepilin-type N-terminal cleavage/methylation domain-containing protein [Arcobacter arenosus]
MKKGFSLLELIFAIVVIGIIASFAIPKYLDTRDDAVASTIQRDLATATTSIQTYYLTKRSISDISDAVQLNTANWTLDNTKLIMTSKNGNGCAKLTIANEKITINIDTNEDICSKLSNLGVTDGTEINLI